MTKLNSLLIIVVALFITSCDAEKSDATVKSGGDTDVVTVTSVSFSGLSELTEATPKTSNDSESEVMVDQPRYETPTESGSKEKIYYFTRECMDSQQLYVDPTVSAEFLKKTFQISFLMIRQLSDGTSTNETVYLYATGETAASYCTGLSAGPETLGTSESADAEAQYKEDISYDLQEFATEVQSKLKTGLN